MSETMTIDFSKLRCFENSPDPGDPACICSLCGKIIPEDEIPIRIGPPDMSKEYRLHWDCFLKVKK